ncbi:MAG TPA: DUF6364 family protein [Casimicrobium sp.]|nr:DUF6364 family protein [Casimicrobium sp.]
MTNLTLTIDENLLRKARILALERNTSVNAMVREFIEKTVAQTQEQTSKADQFVALVERAKFRSSGKRETRQEMYDDDPRMQKLMRIGNATKVGP